jgi:hypothetical protein
MADKRRPATLTSSGTQLDLSLLRDLERVIDLDAKEIAE